MLLIGGDTQLATSAGDAAERYAVRGYDAVHLVTALSIADAELLLLTSHHDLAAAALAASRPRGAGARATVSVTPGHGRLELR